MTTINLQKKYSLINDNNEKNIELEINYRCDDDKTKLFDSRFANKNKDKCKIIYQNKEYELKEYFEDIDHNFKNIEETSFILRINKNITDISYIFFGCDELLLIRDKRNINYFNIDTLIENDIG